jgi:membrane protein DedA with SNARE-associated domain/membrane-associated phospholipid phosphatase
MAQAFEAGPTTAVTPWDKQRVARMSILNALLAYITHHSGLAYGAIFLVSLSESLALVGLIVPGTLIMFGVGAVVATGRLGLQPVLLLAATGAVAGDGISYWLGRRYQEQLERIWPFSRYPGMLKNGELFFRRHGGKSVLFGRFVGPVRPVIPLVAGMLGMGPARFAVINVVSAIGWALAYILPGMLFGTSLAVAGAVSTRLAVLLFLILAACWAFVWLFRKLVLLVGRRGPIWIAALKDWTTRDTPVPRVVRPIRHFLSFLVRRPHGEELFFGGLVLAFFSAGWGFLGVLQDVLAKDPLVLADQSVYHLFQSLRTPWADRIFVALTEFGDSFVNMCLFGAVLIVLLGKRCYRTAGFWVITVLGGLAAVQVLKWTIHLPRPIPLFHGASAYGFPSGHTTMSVILYGFLAIMLVRGLTSTRRWGIVVAALLISFLIALSRLYLGAHWLSDVLGGLFIGTSWAAVFGIAYLKEADEDVPRRWLVAVAVLVAAIAGGWHVTQNHQKGLMLYAPQQTMPSMPLATWLGDGWRDFSAWRIDMGGEREQPLTLQWAGNPAELAHYLMARGWQPPPALDLKTFLAMLSPDTALEKLPVLPRLHSGRVDHLRLVRNQADQRWVLRLWPSGVGIGAGKIPLFVGTIEVQHRRSLTGLITAAGDTGEYDLPQEALKELLVHQFALKSVRWSAAEIQVHRESDRLHWQGRVLLIWKAAELT